jgi:hypothetical protein
MVDVFGVSTVACGPHARNCLDVTEFTSISRARYGQRGRHTASPNRHTDRHSGWQSDHMTRWYPLETADADFLASAPQIFRYEKPFAATPEQVWRFIASDASAAAWGRMIKEVVWPSAPPHGAAVVFHNR